MEKLTLRDILPTAEYEKRREAYRRDVIALKRVRRAAIGDSVSLNFENRTTLLFQIQEMMRAEHIEGEDKIQEEIDIYNDLIPEKNRLSATLFIEVDDPSRIRDTLDRLKGIDNGRSVYLQIGDQKVYGVFEGGRSTEERISSVHYIYFSLSEAQKRELIDGSQAAAFIIDHPNYRHATGMTPELRAELAEDLR